MTNDCALQWADIICRVSTDAQAKEDKVSYAQQEANCRAWCEANGYRVRQVRYEAKSASPHLDPDERHLRPEFWAAWDDLKAGVTHAIAFNDPKRVVRESSSYAYYIELSRKYGKGLVVLETDGKFDSLSPSNRKLMNYIEGMKSEADNEARIKVFTEKKAERFRRGQLAAGRLPLGYRHDKEHHAVEEEPEHAEAVRRIFDLYVNQGLSIAKVKGRLKEIGIPPPAELRGFDYRRNMTGTWGDDAIRNILRNPAYAEGVYRYPFNGEIYDIALPALVDRHTFQRAQRLLATRRRVQRSGVRQAFSGRINCGVCGAAYHKGTFWDRRAKDHRPAYYCRYRNTPTARRRDREPCKASPVLWLREAEEALWWHVLTHLNNPYKLARAAAAHLAHLEAKITALTRGVGHIEESIARLENEKGRWREAWVKFGGDPREIEERIDAIDTELERLRAQADEHKAERDKLHKLQDRRDFINDALRQGLLNLWDVEEDGDYLHLKYRAGRVNQEEYDAWERGEHDPDGPDPEDWAEWQPASVRVTKAQLLDLLAVEVVASPQRLEIRGLLTEAIPLKDQGLPDSSRIIDSWDITRFSSRSGSFIASRSDTPERRFGSRTFG